MHFVHLRLHSEYSITHSTLRIDKALDYAKKDAQVALAMTDEANLFGAVKFYKAALRAGIKPIIGSDVCIDYGKSTGRLLLLVQNKTGYENLCTLLTGAYIDHESPSIPWEILCANHQGLIALSAAAEGIVGQHLLKDEMHEAEQWCQRHAQCFSGRWYIELQRCPLRATESLLQRSLKLAHRCGGTVVATHPVEFLSSDDFDAHLVRVCIAKGTTLEDKNVHHIYATEQYLKTQEEMQALFADLPVALKNSLQIAKRCNFQFELDTPQLPLFATPQHLTLEVFFTEQVHQGLNKRIEAFPQIEMQKTLYLDRIQEEIEVISKQKFLSYFLIVADFISWAKSQNIPVGPGRGSGAGSLVAYCLGITDINPLKFGLLFERFLNPERSSLPDFDIDICQLERDRVIAYVRQRYGEASVSQIATFGTLASRAVIKDVGRVMGFNYHFCDEISKQIPTKVNDLAEAIQKVPELQKRLQNEEEVKQLFEYALKLEGLVRNIGIHAGGVLIAPDKLTKFCPLYQQSDGSILSQFDKDDVEAIGLVKFDLLGLTTLSIIEECVRLIRKHHPEHVDFQISSIPLDDPKVYTMLGNAQTCAVFQLDSSGFQKALTEAKPSRFEDIIAIVALFRPGPMALIPDFCRRKQGEEAIEYLHPCLEPILEETYGVIVYQEQVMQIARVVAEYSLGQADILRRAMGKKDQHTMSKEGAKFIQSATHNTQQHFTKALAQKLFDYIQKFAEYGFNKSHAAAYALVVMQTAWLKCYFPAEFMAANMSLSANNTEHLFELIQEARALGVQVLAPQINASQKNFNPQNSGTILYGLTAIKGLGNAAIEAIVREREKATFVSFQEFCTRIPRQILNRRGLEALVQSGCFDEISSHRAEVFAAIEPTLQWVEFKQQNKNQLSLFAVDSSESTLEQTQTVQVWSERQLLEAETAALGFSLSLQRYTLYAEEFQGMINAKLDQLQALLKSDTQSNYLRFAGILCDIRQVHDEKGGRRYLVMEDDTLKTQLLVSKSIYETCEPLLKKNSAIVITGTIRPIKDPTKEMKAKRFVIESIESIETMRKKIGRSIDIQITQQQANEQFLESLSDLEAHDDQPGLPLRMCIVFEGFEAKFNATRSTFLVSDEALERFYLICGGKQFVSINYPAAHYQ